MPQEPSITPEQAMLAAKAAGLDPDRPLSEQVARSAGPDEQTVKGWVTEAVADAPAAGDGEPADPERSFAANYLDALNHSRTSRWMDEEQADAA